MHRPTAGVTLAVPGHGGDLNRTCPRLRNVYVRVTVPLDEVSWVIRSESLR